jgi:hypothetical protein
MLVYKCDGESYWTGKKCASEVKDELPTMWLSITGNIKNGFHDAHYLECNGMKHFCSPRCLENFLLKGVNPASGQAGVDNMLQDPNVKSEEAQQEAAQESASQDQAMEATQDSEEGGVEG